ncbi:hypothetical protein Nepgr_032373 [Nepenthes gracilis]|uniref:Uncharacterized protein n=1 Tax=Nepenthes gracilis TaxID=150966 RepID=A0AAD3TIG1_NEPGR|nr:hypothetical protein Nepgr_032373 [Nepenthes gracilis]
MAHRDVIDIPASSPSSPRTSFSSVSRPLAKKGGANEQMTEVIGEDDPMGAATTKEGHHLVACRSVCTFPRCTVVIFSATDDDAHGHPLTQKRRALGSRCGGPIIRPNMVVNVRCGHELGSFCTS